MKIKAYFTIMVLAVATLFFSIPSQAEISRVQGNVSVTTFEDPTGENRLDIYILVEDSNSRRPPDVVRWVKVRLPDGNILDITNNWEEWYDDFGAYLPASVLPGGVIQSGRYWISVKDKTTGKEIRVWDDLNASATLTPPQVTYPTSGITVDSLTPTITWTLVPGAEVYRLQLLNVRNQIEGPYWWPDKVQHIHGKTNYFQIPKGVLLNGTEYRVRIEALDKNAFRDHRGRSLWVNFYTP